MVEAVDFMESFFVRQEVFKGIKNAGEVTGTDPRYAVGRTELANSLSAFERRF